MSPSFKKFKAEIAGSKLKKACVVLLVLSFFSLLFMGIGAMLLYGPKVVIIHPKYFFLLTLFLWGLTVMIANIDIMGMIKKEKREFNDEYKLEPEVYPNVTKIRLSFIKRQVAAVYAFCLGVVFTAMPFILLNDGF